MSLFEKKIWQENLTFVEFYATWCDSCQQMHPIITQFEERMGNRTDVYRIDIDDPAMQPIIHRYHVVSVPTLMFFRRGEVLWRESGSVSYHHLVTILEELEEYELAGHHY
ncbi:MAG: thioredoxin family protein [Alistipes sp.]|nr:thioredoxin family protein [Alistipes sp.]